MIFSYAQKSTITSSRDPKNLQTYTTDFSKGKNSEFYEKQRKGWKPLAYLGSV